MSYRTGRRFEYYIVEKIRESGLKARRVPLSGRQPSEDIPNADIVVEDRFFGKAKTTKVKKYVSFPRREIEELLKGDINFLVFNFKKTKPVFIIKIDDFLELVRLWKDKRALK